MLNQGSLIFVPMVLFTRGEVAEDDRTARKYLRLLLHQAAGRI